MQTVRAQKPRVIYHAPDFYHEYESGGLHLDAILQFPPEFLSGFNSCPS